jgi:large subunit ribosomal protein L25
MRKDVTVPAELRQTRGKNAARRTRVAGQIPAVCYGAFKDPVAISVNPKELRRILHSATGHNTIFNLDIQGVENVPVMLVDWQNDPIRGHLLHADLKRLDLTKKLRVSVPVTTVGEPKGVKTQGGLLEIVNREVEIECLPDDIPEHFVADVSELMLGSSVRAKDIPMAEGVVLTGNPEAVIAHVVALRSSEAATPAAEVAPVAVAEPEVIKKGKKEEEAAAEEKGKKK